MSHASTTTRRAADASRTRRRRALSGWVASAWLLAGAAHAAPDPLALCRDLTSWAQAKAADPAVLAKAAADPAVVFAQAVRALPVVTAPPPVTKAAAETIEGQPAVWNAQTFGPDLWHVWDMEGSADCQYDHFLHVPSGGRPAKLTNPQPFGELCWMSSRTMAKVSARTALVETDKLDYPNIGVDVEITPWSEYGWEQTCRTSVRYADIFRVSQSFCNGEPACGDAERLAPKLAQALARSPDGKTLAQVAPIDTATARTLKPRLGEVSELLGFNPGQSPPTFGGELHTAYPVYSGDIYTALVRLDDRPFLVRIGRGGVGWRAIGDYLISYLSPDEHRLTPIATYVVKRDVVGVASASASFPPPWATTP